MIKRSQQFAGRTRRVTAFSLVVAVSCVTSESRGEPARGDAEFTYHQRLIFVSGRVNDKVDVLCLLDTGANVSAIDRQLARRLGLRKIRDSQVVGSAGVVAAENVAVESLEVLGARVGPLEPTSRDIVHGMTPDGRRLDFIIGYDFLKSLVVSIDFERRQLKFTRQSPICESWIPLNLKESIPRLSATINDAFETELRIDTGAGIFETDDVYINMTQSDRDGLAKLGPALKPVSYLSGTGSGGQVRLPVLQLKRLQLGASRVERPFAIIQPEQGYFARPDAVGFVSNNLLEKFGHVVIDYPRSRLGLKCECGDR